MNTSSLHKIRSIKSLKSPKAFLCLLIMLFLNILYVNKVYSLPQDYEVVSGTAEFNKVDNILTINASDKAIVNYKSFDIAANERVIINLPDINSQILNRVNSDNATNIFGTITCNGVFILVNQSGIYIAPTANITSHGVILSTRDITNQNFLDGKLIFQKIGQRDLDKLLLNEGHINITNGGFGVLIAGAVENRGIITAKCGTIAIAGGNYVTLQMAGNSLISIAIEESVANTITDYNGNPVTDQIKNTGTLDAEGGTIILNASSINDIFTKAINLQGVVRANRFEDNDGTVKLIADGDVSISADISATDINIGPDLSGIALNSIAAELQSKKDAPSSVTIEAIANMRAEDLIQITSKNSINVESTIVAPTVTLVSGNDVTTKDSAIIQATNLSITANRFGSSVTPLNLDASNIYIRRLSGDIDIRQSQGIGTSVQILGPPDDGFGQILYNKSTALSLEAGRISLSAGVILEATSLTLTAKYAISSYGSLIANKQIKLWSDGPIYSFGTIKTETLYVNTLNTFRSSGVLDVYYVYEHGASAYLGGKTVIRLGSRFNNLDNAVNISGDVEGWVEDSSEEPNIVFTDNVNLTDDTILYADIDGDGSGTIIMNGYSITGNTHNLIMVTGANNTLDGDITGVNTITFYSSTTANVTYTSTGNIFSVNTVKTAYHTKFSRDKTEVVDSVTYHLIYSVSNAVGGLQFIGTDAYTLGYKYRLANNIDASETSNSGWNSGTGFNPIGGYSTRFTGSLDGRGYTISGLYIYKPMDIVGLFGCISGAAVIRNLGLTGSTVAGYGYTGSLVGINFGSIINSYNTGGVYGSDCTGGLVGWNVGLINSSHNTGIVSGANFVGGLAGWNDGSITYSYNTGTVSGGVDIGGIAGYNDGSITYSNNAGIVSGSSYIGGLAGYNVGVVGYEYYTGLIENSYNTGTVSGNLCIGGLVGWNSNYIAGSNNTGIVFGNSRIGGLAGYSDSGGWIESSYNEGTITSNVIDAGGLVGYNSGSIIGSYNTGIVSGPTSTGGLAGYSDYSISNSYNTGAISGVDTIGGLVGWNDGLIIYSHNSGTVSGGSYIGGLVGYSDGWVDYSYNGGTITGSVIDTGGLVGFNGGEILTSYNTGIVSGVDYVGGLAGYEYDTGSMEDSYNTGNISGNQSIGGLAGWSNSSITGSHNSGSVSGKTGVGGLAGCSNSSIINSYNTGTVTGVDYTGGLTGFNNDLITGSYNTGAVSGHDYVGGLAGSMYACSIIGSHNDGNVSGNLSVGGLVGWSEDIVNTSYNNGSISGYRYIGGLVGSNYGPISDSYNAGSVSGSQSLGGLAGWNSGSITGSYNYGSIIGEGWSVGGLVGVNYEGSITNSYNLFRLPNYATLPDVGGDIELSKEVVNNDNTASGDGGKPPSYNGGNSYNKEYKHGAYKTTVIVMEGKVAVAGYTDKGPDYANAKILVGGEKISVIGVVR